MNFMKLAIDEAKKSGADIPVGAVLVKDGKIIATAHNTKEIDNDITSHAEIITIRKAEQIFNNWRLNYCELYVTLEPCPMCGWAILQSGISKLYFGSYDNNYGAFSTNIDLAKFANSKIKIYGGILENECDKLLSEFFSVIRNK